MLLPLARRTRRVAQGLVGMAAQARQRRVQGGRAPAPARKAGDAAGVRDVAREQVRVAELDQSRSVRDRAPFTPLWPVQEKK